MQTILTVVLVIVCFSLVVSVLLQQGKGADAGAAFGGGASGTVFGAGGSATFLSKATAVLATLFFCLTLGLAYLAGKSGPVSGGDSIMDSVPAPQESDLPAAAQQLNPKIAPEDIAPEAAATTAPILNIESDGASIEAAPAEEAAPAQ